MTTHSSVFSGRRSKSLCQGCRSVFEWSPKGSLCPARPSTCLYRMVFEMAPYPCSRADSSNRVEVEPVTEVRDADQELRRERRPRDRAALLRDGPRGEQGVLFAGAAARRAPEVPDTKVWHARVSGRCTLVGEEDGHWGLSIIHAKIARTRERERHATLLRRRPVPELPRLFGGR